LARRVRALCRVIGSPTRIGELGIARQAFEERIEKLVDDAFNDTQIVTACRSPSYDEMGQIWRYAFDGRAIDF